MPDPSEPDQAELRRLHDELCTGEDPTVPARLAELLLPALQRRFRRVPGADPHSLESLIGLSIARYLNDPHRYRPDKGPLLAYLWKDIEGDRRNELASRGARRSHEVPDTAAVEVEAGDRNLSVEEEVLDALDPLDMPRRLLDAARTEATAFSDQDRELLMLMADGVRESASYAEVLGIGHLPPADYKREVKRHKDRLKARLEVIRGQLGRST